MATPLDHEIEQFRRSIAMLPPQSKALSREEAMSLLERLDTVTHELRRLRDGLRVLLADAH